MVIHGGIDGYSRWISTFTSVQIIRHKQSWHFLRMQLIVYGLSSRIRGNHDKENVDVAWLVDNSFQILKFSFKHIYAWTKINIQQSCNCKCFQLKCQYKERYATNKVKLCRARKFSFLSKILIFAVDFQQLHKME